MAEAVRVPPRKALLISWTSSTFGGLSLGPVWLSVNHAGQLRVGATPSDLGGAAGAGAHFLLHIALLRHNARYMIHPQGTNSFPLQELVPLLASGLG